MHLDILCKWRCAVLFLLVASVSATSVQMRVVRDTASYGYFGSNTENENNQHATTVQPANFSGPQLLQKLTGKCFNLTQGQYLYTFCPFQNFSQHELSSRWNAYHGVLGVWNHWDIENNTFQAMVYSHGDQCGEIERTVHVKLKCGNGSALVNVTEPSRCKYSAIFQSKYVCHNDSLLVYPRLKKELQEKWDHLLTEFKNGDITEKGYKMGLGKLYRLAGFREDSVSDSPQKVVTKTSTQPESLFTDLATCNKEYKNLASEIARLNQELDTLKMLLDLNKLESKTIKPR